MPDNIYGLVNSELFVIDRDDGQTSLLYSPLNKKVGVINKSGVNTLYKYMNRELMSESETSYISELYRNEFLNREELRTPTFPVNYCFMPHEVTLFLTSRCNLRCRYCYAEAGKKSVDMPSEIARAAVALVAENAGLAGLPKFAVGFHGGGEPTMAWAVLTDAVEYARELADSKGLDLEVFAATNGMLGVSQREFIVKNFTNLNISIDGPADLQNFNRPTVRGDGSFDVIRDNLRYFDEQGFPYGIRATITEKSVERMCEIIEWFHVEFHPEFLHLEPVWQCGRCLTTGETAPNDETFARNFIAADKRASELGIRLSYSGLRLDSLLSKFCAASGDGFNVLPDGIVTSCYEITEPDDPKAELFHYGKYDVVTRSFTFNKKKIKQLQQYSVENLEYCRNCFCKWHCAGDCISKVFDVSHSFDHLGSPRCNLNRQLTRIKLEELLIKK